MPFRSNVITDDVTEMPRCCSICIQSERVRRGYYQAVGGREDAVVLRRTLAKRR
jgi:hypothetical protein